MSEPFIAEIRIFAGNFAPYGWAFCDGALLPIATNTALFSIIGTTYGGDGRTTMALPNMQGRTPMHPGRGPGLTARRLGERIGTENETLTELQMPSHHHMVRAHAGAGAEATPGNTTAIASASARDALYQTDTQSNIVEMDEGTVSNTGGGQSHYNMQPVLSLNFIIALQGLYPSRG